MSNAGSFTVPTCGAAGAHSNAFCAACGDKFEFRRRGKSRCLMRYSLRVLGLSDSSYATKGDFACPACRSKFLRKRTSKKKHVVEGSNKDTSKNFNDHSYAKQASYSTATFSSASANSDGNYSELPNTPQSSHHATKRPNSNAFNRSFKRPCVSDTQSPPVSSRLKFKEPTIEFIRKGKYFKALREMHRSNNRAVKAAITKFCSNVISKEISNFCRKPPSKSMFCQKFSLENIDEFSWKDALQEAEKAMPLLTCVLTAMFPKKMPLMSRGNNRRNRLKTQ